MEQKSLSPMDFVIRIILVIAGLAFMSDLISSGFALRFGLVLFILGIVSMGIGNMLSLPARRYERLSGVRHVTLFKLPSPEEYVAGNLFVARHAASFYSFENALLLAGFIVVLIGLFILL